MNMQETARLMDALRSAGWTDTQIVNLMMYIESGDERYKPKPEKQER